MVKNFGGLLKHRRGYHFLNPNDLLRYFIQEHYPDECVVVLLDCKKAFINIPKLNILKRDDYSSYLMGISNDWVIIEFANIAMAVDYVYSFPAELQLQYLVYKNGQLTQTEKGKV